MDSSTRRVSAPRSGRPVNIVRDLRFGARLTIRNPAFSAICVITLGVGIGLTVTMFSIINGMLLRDLPFDEPDRLAAVSYVDAARGYRDLTIPLPDLVDYREDQQAFEGLAGYRLGTFHVSGDDGAKRYEGAWFSANTLDLLRIRPILGRAFHERDEAAGAELVTLIGYRLWQDRFGGDPQVLGQTMRINGETATVVGVMGEGFMFPARQALWVPIRHETGAYDRGGSRTPWLRVIGRLKPGASIDEARSQLGAISQRLAAVYPETNEHLRARVVTLAESFHEQSMGDGGAQFLATMLGAAFLVLVLACVNVATLLLGKAALRSREVAIRKALGASRRRIVAQFLAEPVILAGAGAVLGVGLASMGGSLFLSSIPAANTSYWLDFGIDGTVLLFVIGLALFSTLAAGLLPAIRASDGNVGEMLKDDSRATSGFRASRLTRSLVIAQLAIALVILTGAALMIRSVAHAMSVDYPFPTEDVFTAQVGFPLEYPAYATVAERVRFFETVEARLAEEPGIRGVAIASALPGDRADADIVSVEGRAEDGRPGQVLAHWAAVTPAFFDLFEVAVLEGRSFDFGDRADGLRVAVVNESFVRRHFPDGQAVGRRVRFGGADSQSPWRTIVGVVPDLHISGAHDRGQNRAGLYIPLAQTTGTRFMTIAARTAGPPTLITPQVRAAVASLDPDMPIDPARPLGEVIRGLAWDLHLLGRMVTIPGLVALFLAAIGLYGVVSFSVSRRTREMGVRMALGADSGQVMRLVMRQGVVQLAIGLLLGLLGALAMGQLLQGFLWNISPRDPVAFTVSVMVLTFAGVIAAWLPARRATRVDPLVAIRDE